MFLFYALFVALAVIVAVGFFWALFSSPAPQPEAPQRPEKPAKTKPKHHNRKQQQLAAKKPPVATTIPQDPENDLDLLHWRAGTTQSTKPKVEAKPEVKKPEKKPEAKKEEKPTTEQSAAAGADAAPMAATSEATEPPKPEALLQKEVEDLIKELGKRSRSNVLLRLHSKQHKEALAKQEKVTVAMDQYFKDKIQKLEKELEAVKTNTEALVSNKRDTLNQRNYVKTRTQTQLQIAKQTALRLEEDIKVKDKRVQELEAEAQRKTGSVTDQLEHARTVNQQLEAENKLLHEKTKGGEQSLKDELDKAEKDLFALKTQHEATKGALAKAKADLANKSSVEPLVGSLTNELSEADKKNKLLSRDVEKEQQRAATIMGQLQEKNEEFKSKLAAATKEQQELKDKIAKLQQLAS